MTSIFTPSTTMETWPGDTGLKTIKSFAIESSSVSDVNLLLGPFRPDETVTLVPNTWTLAHIMHAVGVFGSVNQAKSNGWNKPIPPGLTILNASKKKIPVCILGEMPPYS